MTQTEPKLCTLEIDGDLTQRGFWLYVWTGYKDGRAYHYVGRTGDNGYPTALSPIQRFARHMTEPEDKGVFGKPRKMRDGKTFDLKRHDFERFELKSYGPILPEAEGEGIEPKRVQVHKERRDKAAALEKRLCDALHKLCQEDEFEAGVVINPVNSKIEVDETLWLGVHQAFSEHFRNLPLAVSDAL